MVKPKNNGSSGGSSSSNSSSNSSSSSSSSSSNATAKTTKKKQKTTQDPSKAPDLILKSLMRQLPLPSSNGRDFKLFNANSISQQSRRSAVRTYAELSSKQRLCRRSLLRLRHSKITKTNVSVQTIHCMHRPDHRRWKRAGQDRDGRGISGRRCRRRL